MAVTTSLVVKQMSLDVKKDQLEMIEGLQGFLKRVDLLDQGIVSNRIKASHVEQALTAFFPNKSKPRLRELVDAMLFDSKADEGVEDQKKRQGGEEDEEEEEEEESDEKYINCLSLFRESDQSSSRCVASNCVMFARSYCCALGSNCRHLVMPRCSAPTQDVAHSATAAHG